MSGYIDCGDIPVTIVAASAGTVVVTFDRTYGVPGVGCAGRLSFQPGTTDVRLTRALQDLVDEYGRASVRRALDTEVMP